MFFIWWIIFCCASLSVSVPVMVLVGWLSTLCTGTDSHLSVLANAQKIRIHVSVRYNYRRMYSTVRKHLRLWCPATVHWLPFVSSTIDNCLDTFFYRKRFKLILFLRIIRAEDVRDVPYFLEHYCTLHHRITSYFIGVLVGAVLYDHRRQPWQLGKVPVTSASFMIIYTIRFDNEIIALCSVTLHLCFSLCRFRRTFCLFC